MAEMLSEDQKMGETKDISSFLLFLLFFLEKNVPKNVISNTLNFLIMQNFHFLTIKGKSGCFVVLSCCWFYVKQKLYSAIFSKMQKPNHEIVIFRKHFSHSLRNIYSLFCFSFGILIYFTFLLSFWQKISVLKILF